jgi:hypothetical protein
MQGGLAVGQQLAPDGSLVKPGAPPMPAAPDWTQITGVANPMAPPFQRVGGVANPAQMAAWGGLRAPAMMGPWGGDLMSLWQFAQRGGWPMRTPPWFPR